MDPLLEVLLGKFNLSDDVVLTIDKNGKKSYLRGIIAAIQEKYLLISTKGSIVKIAPESIIQITKPQSGSTKLSSRKSTKANSNSTTNNADKDPSSQQTKTGANTASKPLPNKILKSTSIEPIRLNKFLANLGLCSRREADELILAGRITINGEIITELGAKVQRDEEVRICDSRVVLNSKISNTPQENNKQSIPNPPINIKAEQPVNPQQDHISTPDKIDEKKGSLIDKPYLKKNTDSSSYDEQEQSLISSQEEWNPKMIIPKMGDIVEVNGDEVVILTNENKKIITSRTIIIDKKLNKQITEYVVSKRQIIGIPVIWGKIDNEILCLLGQITLEGINSRINTSRDVGNVKVAYALALLLNKYSSHPAYVKQLQSFQKEGAIIDKALVPMIKETTSTNSGKPLTIQGKEAKEAGEFERALKLLQRAIETEGENKPRAFQEQVNVLITMERFEDAYALLSSPGIMDFTSPLMPNSQNNFYWLSSSLSRTGHDEKVIEINESRANYAGITPKQKAACYNRIAAAILRIDVDGQEDKAEEYYKKALEVDPTNKTAKAALSSMRPENFEMVSGEAIIDMESSSFAEDKLPTIPEDKRSKQYKDSLKEQLHVLRSNSYSERAETHLRLAAVEKALGHDSDMHIDLAKYLLNSVLERRRNKNLDSESAIFMLCESISHWSAHERYERYHGRERRSITHYQDCLALYINLFNRQNPSYFFSSPKLYLAFENRLYETPEFYMGLPDFMFYRVPFSILMKDLWETSALSSAINFLNEHDYSYAIESGKDNFDQGFKTVVNRERANLSDIINRLKHMSKSSGYEELKGRLDEIGQPALKYELDMKRFSRFKDFVCNTLTRYFHNEDITNKYYTQEDSLRTIDTLVNEIVNEPTRFSYDGLRPVLIGIRNLVQADYTRLSEISKPKIEIDQSGDCILEKDVVSFQLNIQNSKGSLAINNFHIEILKSEDVIEHIDGMNIVYDSLSGGSDKNLIQRIKISPLAASSETVTINVILHHGTVGMSGEQPPIKRSISLHLRNDDIPTSNPYSRYAGGKPIESRGGERNKMFFGREEDIQSTADSMMSDEVGKQIIIYGQSRSGKTSFRNMLAIELEKRGAWCAKFSLQNMNPPFSTGFFFAFIIESIVNLLYEEEGWTESDNKYAVNNHATIINDVYRETPESSIATQFINDMCSLQRTVRKKWDKKLILMIDEFTELYTWIKKGLMPDNIMKIWKAISEDDRLDYSVVLIGQDTTPLFMLEPYASNPFQVIEPRRMSYLPEQDARKMIEQPILDCNNRSRFVGKAVDRIIKYTAGSPYYLMIFCSRLVDYMKLDKHIGKVTDVDVDEVAKLCITEKKLDGKFDNLYAAVEPQPYEKERSQAVLKTIAVGMNKQKDGISRADILSELKDRYSEDEINTVLSDLDAREVVTTKLNVANTLQDRFIINVIIFQRWLIKDEEFNN